MTRHGGATIAFVFRKTRRSCLGWSSFHATVSLSISRRVGQWGAVVRAFRRPEFIPLAEAASRLGCSIRTLQRIARDGGISFVRRGRFAHVMREDLARLEVDGRTDWLVARLSGDSAESMRVAEWLRQWSELQRLVTASAEDAALQSSLLAAEHVIERDGLRSMADYRVVDLAAALGSSDLAAEDAIGLRILAAWPRSPRLLDAYREALRALVGWQPTPEAPTGRLGRLRNGRHRPNGEVAG